MGRIVRELLTPAGMAAARAALIEDFSWFTHGSALANFDGIRTHGLRLSNPFTRDQLTVVGGDPRQQPAASVICLQPFPKARFLPVPGPACKLALNWHALPERIGIDYSFGGALEMVRRLHRQHPDWSAERIFMMVLNEYESFVAYDAIPARALRVCPKAQPDLAPEQWPELNATQVAEVHVVPADLEQMSWL